MQELVGVRASLARRLKVAEEHLAQARTQNEQLMASMAAERATRERAERETDDARRAAASRTQTITLMRREMEHANNVTQQQWNLLDAARVHLSEVMAAKEALEATHAQAALSPGRLGPRAASGDCSVAMTPRLAKRLVGPGQTGSVEGFVHAAADVEGFVSHLAAVCDSPRTAGTPLPVCARPICCSARACDECASALTRCGIAGIHAHALKGGRAGPHRRHGGARWGP
jgi:hypothetical protein